jgi:glycerophosphoryl diester phosphodiesterase
MREAARQGAGGVEFDAKLTSDGVVILMHDDTLERTTNGRGRVADTPAAAIAALDAGAWRGPRWAGARVPTLKATLRLCVELGLYPNIEIKPCSGREAETTRGVIDVVRAVWPAHRPPPLLSSFALDSVVEARDMAPDLPRGLLVEEVPQEWREQTRALGCASLHVAREYVTAALVPALHEPGLACVVYTVNDAAEAQRLLAWGIDAIITDRVGAVLSSLGTDNRR